MTYTISINGQKAVDTARKIQKNHCYKRLFKNGKYLAQMEIVLDDDGVYNGKPNKWVDVSYISTYENVFKTIQLLIKLGFNDCFCFLAEESEEDNHYRELFTFTLGELISTKEDEV